MSLHDPSSSAPWRRRSRAAVIGASALALVAGGLTASALSSAGPAAPAAAAGACPAGYTSYADYLAQEQRVQAAASGGGDALTALADAFAVEKARSGESIAAGTCLNAKHPESMGELTLRRWRRRSRASRRSARCGPVRSARPQAALGDEARLGRRHRRHREAVRRRPARRRRPRLPRGQRPGPAGQLGARRPVLLRRRHRPPARRGRQRRHLPVDRPRAALDVDQRPDAEHDHRRRRLRRRRRAPARRGPSRITGDGPSAPSGLTGFGAYYTTDLDSALSSEAASRPGPAPPACRTAPSASPSRSTRPTPTSSTPPPRSASTGRPTAGARFANAKLPTGVAKSGGTAVRRRLRPVQAPRLRPRQHRHRRRRAGARRRRRPPRAAASSRPSAGAAATSKNADGTVQSPSNGIYGSATGAARHRSPRSTHGDGTPLGSPSRTASAASRSARPTARRRTTATSTRSCRTPASSTAAASSSTARPRCPSSSCDPVLGACPLEGGTSSRACTCPPTSATPGSQLGDDNTIGRNPAAGSALVGLGPATATSRACRAGTTCGSRPTRPARVGGVPARLPFGLEEVWENETSAPRQDNRRRLQRHRPLLRRRLLPARSSLGLPTCPTNRDEPLDSTTTHPDQHAGLFVPVDPKAWPRASTCWPATTAACSARPSPRAPGTTPGTRTARPSASRPTTSTTATGAAAPTRASTPCCPTTRRWPRTAPSGRACRTTAT